MRSGFFNSNITGYDDYGNPIYDRAEEASFFAEFFADFIGTGVYPNPSTGMQVIENEKMTLLVKPGSCFINGYRGKVEEGGEPVTLEEADTSYSRIDRIVARLNIEDREIKLSVITGTPSTNPSAKELTQNSNIHEIALADVIVKANTTTITQADITDTRLDTELCGVVVGVIEQLDTTTLFKQYQTWFEEMQRQSNSDYQTWFEGFAVLSEEEFNDWFDKIKGQLGEDVAGNLQKQIDGLNVYKYQVVITESIEAGSEIEIPCSYKVGADALDVYLNGERLILSSDETGTDGHYVEVGETDSISNKIKITTDWSLEAGDVLDLVVRGDYSDTET